MRCTDCIYLNFKLGESSTGYGMCVPIKWKCKKDRVVFFNSMSQQVACSFFRRGTCTDCGFYEPAVTREVESASRTVHNAKEDTIETELQILHEATCRKNAPTAKGWPKLIDNEDSPPLWCGEFKSRL